MNIFRMQDDERKVVCLAGKLSATERSWEDEIWLFQENASNKETENLMRTWAQANETLCYECKTRMREGDDQTVVVAMTEPHQNISD